MSETNDVDAVVMPCHDPEHEGNSAKHHTGEECCERDCKRPAGTAWSPYWCFECNSARIKHIDDCFERLKA